MIQVAAHRVVGAAQKYPTWVVVNFRQAIESSNFYSLFFKYEENNLRQYDSSKG